MKGISVKQNLEFILNTEGENWIQGDVIRGTIAVKNNGTSAEKISGSLLVILAHGDLKKVHNKSKNAWTVIINKYTTQQEQEQEQVQAQEHIEIKAGEVFQKRFEFKLSIDAHITDKSGSLYLLYGCSDEPMENLPHLQLMVNHNQVITFFIEAVERFVRFKVKQIKFDKDEKYVDIKLIAPATRELSSIDSLVCSLKVLEDKDNPLKIIYHFTLKSLDIANGGQAELQKKKKDFEQILKQNEYCIYGNSPNYDGIKNRFQEIIKEIIPRLL
ncbi:MAG: hypothetical protein HQK51_17540 [Oligoflexia bacterium]|nr:hypothetical protein [Oligoflexia bacterium]